MTTMTGICYFTDEDTRYLAESQATAVAECYDDTMLINENGRFTPEKADMMIQEALDGGCDGLVFIAEDYLVPTLEKLIPESYKSFRKVEVLEEDYDRLTENDIAAEPQAQTQTQVVQKQPAQQQVKQAEKKLIVMPGIASPLPRMLGAYQKDLTNIANAVKNGQYANAGVDASTPIVTWLAAVDSAGLTGTGTKLLFSKFPGYKFDGSQINLDSSDNTRDGSVELIVSNFLQSNPSYKFVVPQNAAALKGKYSNVIGVLPNSYENPNNEPIYKMMMTLADTSKELEKSKLKDEDLSKKIEADKDKIEFIQAYIKCVSMYKDLMSKGKVYKSKDLESQLAQAIKDTILQMSGFNAAKQELENSSVFLRDTFNAIGKIANGLKKDVKDPFENNDKKDKETEKKSNNRLQKSIVSWVHYDKLCKLLEISK